jgi:hypothetical protein
VKSKSIGEITGLGYVNMCVNVACKQLTRYVKQTGKRDHEVNVNAASFVKDQGRWRVWSVILGWLEINFLTPQSLFKHFECWSGEIRNKKVCKGFWLICTPLFG